MAYKNWHEKAQQKLSLGDRIADKVSTNMGSWRFIIIQSCIIAFWISGNAWLLFHFDPFPYRTYKRDSSVNTRDARVP